MIWSDKFSEVILDRGYDYYRRNLVRDFNVSHNTIYATVRGSEYYDVEIELKNNKIVEMYCDCPYAADGNYCKHMAATLFYATNEEGGLDKDTDSDVETLVKNADEKVVQDFLITVLKKDKNLYMKFKNMSVTEISEADIENYKRLIDDIFEKYGRRYGYIEYHETIDFTEDIIEFFDNYIDTIIKKKQFEDAFKLTGYIFFRLGNQDIDDSNGTLGDLAYLCEKVWMEILDNCNIETKNLMFDWFLEIFDGSIYDFLEEYIENILFNNFQESEFLLKKLDFTEKMFNKYLYEESDSWSVEYNIEKWIVYHLDVMKEMKISEANILKFVKKYLKYNSIRKYYVQYCIDKEDYKTAIDVLIDGKKKEKDALGLVIQYSLQLKDLYKKIGDQQAYKKELWLLVTEYKEDDLELYRELKSLYSEKEWEEKRELIFEKVKGHGYLGILYKEEKLYDRLLNYVLSYRGISVLVKYEECLKKLYPNELLEKYEETIRGMAKNVSDRKSYREIAGLLKDMLKYKGGTEKVNQIVSDFRIAYKKRPAMMDELKHL